MQLHCFRAVTAGLRKRMQSGWTTFKFTASIGDGCRVYNHHFSLFNTRVVLTICGWKLQDFNSDLYKIKKHKQEAQINTGAVGTACMHSFCICHSTFIHFFLSNNLWHKSCKDRPWGHIWACPTTYCLHPVSDLSATKERRKCEESKNETECRKVINNIVRRHWAHERVSWEDI